ncbi:MAG TPA: phenylalanine--tRNA ligase subunit alpha [Candidatus Paceibacterota bacterium]|nr:phenylalanine--tRNA ligase subunit alpha [Candidatus Paceibacterota bacterium]
MDAKTLQKQALEAIEQAKSLAELETAYKAFLGKSGQLTGILRGLAALPDEERKTQGKEANELRDLLEQHFAAKKREIQEQGVLASDSAKIDVTAPGKRIAKGHLHPLTLIQRKTQEIFGSMGFEVVEGPEIETEWYNFDALNIPSGHPARDLWDTFWLKDSDKLLRTHTSPVQARYMEKHEPPFRIIAPGRIFRYEATDASHEINFYQLEGLMVGKEVSVANFKAVIEEFYRQFFERKVEIRLRPSYFPFTEPSFEIDMRWGKENWLEMMGAGMVHPNVFKAVGYIPDDWQGFAFGMGLDRLAMMKYRIPDIRLLYSGDLNFLKQF